jgi:hypothetical protein
MMISRSKWRPLKSSSTLNMPVSFTESYARAKYARLLIFAPHPPSEAAASALVANVRFTSPPPVFGRNAQIAEVRRGHGERRCLKYMRNKPMQVNVSPSQNALGYC